jgi:DNA-binding protein H-NS
MSKSCIQLIQEIEALQKQAETIRQQERVGVIQRIRETISSMGLTVADLGIDAAMKPKANASTAPVRKLAARGKSLSQLLI